MDQTTPEPPVVTDEKFVRLKKLLMELFQLNQPDLDFGIYRILHARAAEIGQFLDKELLPEVRKAFELYRPADRAALEEELAKTIKQAEELGADPESLPKVKDFRSRLESDAVDVSVLEQEVYDHLYRFFRRYYSEGDFLAKRVYKPGTYAIPYEGEETKLHWANRDQYYIKTTEYLSDYSFRLRPSDSKEPRRVHFRLRDAEEGEHGTVKAAEGKERVFILVPDDPAEEIDGELVLWFEYRPATVNDWPASQREGKAKPPAQKDLITSATDQVLALSEDSLKAWIDELGQAHTTAAGDKADYSRLESHLRRYAARNTFDYFIHKDLGRFLRQELDFFIKNEVMHLDDIDSESQPKVEQYLSKIKILRSIAGKMIDFVAQVEDFQRSLWLKQKFVVRSDYCVRVDMVPAELHDEILGNEAQVAEWAAFLGSDKVKPPLSGEFFQAYPTLLVDTAYFSRDFCERLISHFGNLDEVTDGWLMQGDNFHALQLLAPRFRGAVECIYIDPPYNTGDSEIPYKNAYLHSSWLTLMANRLEQAMPLLAEDSVLFIAIDDFEMVALSKMVDSEFSQLRREMIIVNHHPQGGKAKALAHTHEYMLTCFPGSSDRTLVGRTSDEGIEQRPFKRSGTAESNFRHGRPNSFYAILVEPDTHEIKGLEPPPEADYPLEPTSEGLLRVYPLGSGGQERVWRRSYESCLTLVEQGKLRATDSLTIYQLIPADERTAALFSNWVDPRYNAGTFGANLLRDILGEQNLFSYPKSIHTVGDALFAAGIDKDAVVVDFFAGSGTTGHAVINLNREQQARRKFILVEAAGYFDQVLVPRIKKITLAPEWKEGMPVELPTSEERDQSPRVLKITRLETYEDALNNVQVARTPTQQSLLESPEGQEASGFRESYLLHYMLEIETRDSPSLLNATAFVDPDSYTLRLRRGGSDESADVPVDLTETFNCLLGLQVERISTRRGYTADLKRDSEGRLKVLTLQEQGAGEAAPWWFQTITGRTRENRAVLIVWRRLTADPEQDNAVLDAWFVDQGYSSKRSTFDIIYVNGDNNISNLRTSDASWKVRTIEEDFRRLMFATTHG